MMRQLSSLLLLFSLAACSSLPPAISDAPLYDLSYPEAVANGVRFNQAPVRWGGIIVDLVNEQQRSVLQVLAYPLESNGRPLTDDRYFGRFVITTPEFLDPAIYTKKSKITVAGTLSGTLERTVDHKTLNLPLITQATYHLWMDYPVTNYGYGGFGVGYGALYGYPAWGMYRPLVAPWRR
jgi:outer membrane lipoprotein